MIVTCERCSTQFRLDDKRVPEQGVRVRCSRCKYAFRVDPPAATEEERVHRAAAQALEPGTPDVTQDLPDEEQDWQFNDDRPAGDPGDSDPDGITVETEPEGSPLQSAMGAPGDAYGFGGELGSHEADGFGGDAEASMADSGLELGDRGGSAAPADPTDAFDLSGGASGLDLAGPERPEAGPDREPPAAPPRRERRAAAQPSAASGGAEDIGSPDKWDFFASEGGEKSPTPSRVKLTAVPPRRDAPRATALPREVVEEVETLHSPWLERMVDSVGWTVVAAVFALGLYGGFAPGAHGSASVSGSQRVADMEVDGVAGRWVENLVAGDLYVISGTVRRGAAAGRADNGGLFLSLLDARGERLRLAPVPVGPPLPEALLRQADPTYLHRTAGRTFSPEPGATQRVEAVIPRPPAAARNFRFVTGAELAALNVEAPVRGAANGEVHASDASGEMPPPEAGVRPEASIETP